MKKRPVIGLLCITLVTQPEYEEIGLELASAIMDLEIDLIAFTPYGIQWETGQVRGKALIEGEWQKSEMTLPKAIYNRLYGTHPNTIQRLENQVGKACIFNRENRLDKYQVYETLLNTQCSILPWTKECSWDNLMEGFSAFQQVVLKPKIGHYGLDIYRVSREGLGIYNIYQRKLNQPILRLTLNQLKSFIAELASTGSRQQYLIQQFIEPASWRGRYFDIRVLVQKNYIGVWQVTAMVSRVARKNHFATNDTYKLEQPENLLASANSSSIKEKVKRISLQVANVFTDQIGSFGELGIDYVIDQQDQPWLIEVNGKPRKDLFDVVDNKEVLEKVYLRPLEYAKFLATTSKL